MYSTLAHLGKVDQSITDSKKYSCCVSIPPSSTFPSYYSNQIQYSKPEYFSTPSLDVNPHLASSSMDISSSFPVLSSEMNNNNQQVFRKELYSSQPTTTTTTLLPVLDCRFNLREICKQCILLEDHLSHPEKRCTDCCIKHFLALEGLGEEAVTLDSKQDYVHQLQSLPTKIRSIQQYWFQNPEKHSRKASELLRQLRKEFMIQVFDLDSFQSCSNGHCSIKSNKPDSSPYKKVHKS